MALADEILAAQTALLTRITSLSAAASPQEVVFAAKALEALRGSVSLQAIIESSDSGLSAIGVALSSALGDLATAKTGHSDDLSDVKVALADQLNDLAVELTNNYLSGANAIGAPRIGDIWLAIYPDPTNLPANVRICDGTYIDPEDMEPLELAWGLNSGGTVKPFVTNYNATVDAGIQIIKNGSGLRLPVMNGSFLQAVAAADMGKYTVDTIKAHTHDVASTYAASGANGVTLSAPGTSKFTSGTITSTSVGTTETKPKSFGALTLVRYK